MAYILNEEQLELKELVADFMSKEVKPRLHELDESGEFPLDIYKKAFDIGLNMLNIPTEYGGSGLSHETFGVLLEEMGYYDPGFAITILTSSVLLKCTLMAGTDSQKEMVANIFENGGLASFCLTEPGSGSDSVSIRTTYKKDGDSIILNGTKCFVTNGEYADIYIVFATKDRSLGSKGISAFLVERDRPGLTVGKHENKMGLRLSNTCDVIFEDVRIPAENLVGVEGKGLHVALGVLDSGRLDNACISTGLCQAALDEAVKYAKERHTFGVPIIKHQAVQMILADMAMYTEAARQLVRSGMSAMDRGENVTKIASMSKAFCSDAAVKVATDAVQILGGYGYSKEYPVEKMMRDSKIFQIFEGTNQIQRMVIARELAR